MATPDKNLTIEDKKKLVDSMRDLDGIDDPPGLVKEANQYAAAKVDIWRLLMQVRTQEGAEQMIIAARVVHAQHFNAFIAGAIAGIRLSDEKRKESRADQKDTLLNSGEKVKALESARPATQDELKSWKDRWTQGYACAVASVQKLDGSKLLTTDVKELMRAGGLTLAACKEAGVDEGDMDILFPSRAQHDKKEVTS